MHHLKIKQLTFLVSLLSIIQLKAQHDLALFANINKRIAKAEQEIILSIAVYNQRGTDVTNLKVITQLPESVKWIRDDSKGSYNVATGIWTIGKMGKQTDSVKLNIVFSSNTEGVNFFLAEITSMDGHDDDSTPNNQNTSEDDLATTCVSLPLKVCSNDFEITVSALEGFANYQWYRNDTAIINGNSRSYLISKVGAYHCRAFLPNGAESPVFSCPLVVDTLTAPSVITTNRRIELGEAVSIQTFAVDQNLHTFREGKLSFHTNRDDAFRNINPLPNLTVAPTTTTTYFARKTTARCADVKSLKIEVTAAK